MIKIVGIRFREGGRVFHFKPLDEECRIGDPVIVETKHGLEMGFVAFMPRFLPEHLLKYPLQEVLRIAGEEDMEIRRRQEEREEEALHIARDLVAEHGLDMQVNSAQHLTNEEKMVFYFTAEERVDFRSLVKDLAQVFRMRIELRQIGVRDDAARSGGIGCCGRELCCSSFLKDFGHVSVKMAKNQNLSMNPAKISGACGRLLCCLRYEDDVYSETRSRAPKIGAVIRTRAGSGRVRSVNLIKESFILESELPSGESECRELRFEEWLDAPPDKKSEGKCCGGCRQQNTGEADEAVFLSPEDAARERVAEWVAEAAGDPEEIPGYLPTSEMAVEEDYFAEAEEAAQPIHEELNFEPSRFLEKMEAELLREKKEQEQQSVRRRERRPAPGGSRPREAAAARRREAAAVQKPPRGKPTLARRKSFGPKKRGR